MRKRKREIQILFFERVDLLNHLLVSHIYMDLE